MFSFFKREKLPTQMPDWEQIVQLMYGQQLSNYQGRVMEVLYSQDKTMRVLLLKNRKGLYHYNFEKIEPYELEDYIYYKKMNRDTLPAVWVYLDSGEDAQQHTSEDAAARALAQEPMFLQYFT